MMMPGLPNTTNFCYIIPYRLIGKTVFRQIFPNSGAFGRIETLPVLIAQTGPMNGQRWLLEHAVIIGRDPSCESDHQ